VAFRALSRFAKRLLLRRQRTDIQDQGASSSSPHASLSKRLRENEAFIRDAFGNSCDLIVRKVRFGTGPGIAVLVVHIDGLVDTALVSEAIIKPIGVTSEILQSERLSSIQVQDRLRDRLILLSAVKQVSDKAGLLNCIAGGKCGIVVDGSSEAFVCDVRGFEKRGVEEPQSEVVIRGPREGFSEVLRVNTSLLRRRIRNPRFWIEEFTVGRVSRTQVAIAYIKGIADDNVIREARERITRIDIDSIQESGELEEYLEDAPFSPFPTILRTERPDRVAGALFEGRIAILTDGTPFVLIVPVTFLMFLTSPEDYYERFFIASAIRLLRYASFFIAFLLPALYVAITTFHQEMLPTPLVLAIAAQREGVPFPAVFEALLMEVAFEILREAAVRLPKIYGPAISIVGVLILGEAAVRAGLVSSAMIIVVALTAIASFVTPIFSLSIAVRLLRFPIILLGGTLGLFGVVFGFLIVGIHLSSLRSFGVPFLEPIAPVVVSDLKDALIRLPWWAMDTRPEFTGKSDLRRQSRGLMPRPPQPHAKGIPSTHGKKGPR
jgi:spore germination protein KA